MKVRRCPLCWVTPESGVIEHLRRDHRRSGRRSARTAGAYQRTRLGLERRKPEERSLGANCSVWQTSLSISTYGTKYGEPRSFPSLVRQTLGVSR